PGDWLYEHEEKGQSFEQYIKFKPVSPNEVQKKIYLQPVGTFSALQQELIKSTAEYLRIFFGLEIIIQPAIEDSIIPSTARRLREDGHEQFLTTYIMDYLEKNIPQDAIVIMAITVNDLYPADSWNFVFGQARLKKRVGVSSIYWYTDGPVDSSSYTLCLQRLIKTSSHEIGHMFSCEHCTHAVCVMNGSNSVVESDSRPNRLCSECLKKLYWNLKFNLPERYSMLENYFSANKMDNDYQLISRDREVFSAKR
ncbi:MAG TPA: archaemetzincin, partial [Ohtaekwangia sp.]|uniref:archaemetzincin n=1 Tax=Ohtaekwangia sp. TaxID=2066019 RepID=UPI002F9549A5